MTRRTCVTVMTAALAASPIVTGKESNSMREILETSQNEKKSVMLYVKGQSFGGMVTKLGADTAELRNREYGRIVVRIDSIDAVAMI